MSKQDLQADLQSENVLINQDVKQKKKDGDILSQVKKDDEPVSLEILEQLKKNEKVSQEILRSLNFIKQHYLWRSIFNFLKVFIVVAVIVLGIVSWRSIVDYVTSSLPGNFSDQVIDKNNN